jgi:recombination protein RecT
MSTQLTKSTEKDTPSARFTAKVIREYQVASGSSEMTPEMKRRIQNYFIKIDMVLNVSESKRASKRDAETTTPFTWQSVNMDKLAIDCMTRASLGLDPLTDNHVHPIPYLNSRTGKYDFEMMTGYKGKEVIARKFALVPPKDVVCELVYSTDIFSMKKRDSQNNVESYEFQITQPFDRGALLGGFIYTIYEDATLNSLEVLSVAEIEKRKPKYASAEFWGGEKTVYVNGKPTKEHTDGWYKEMALKTLKRKGWGAITLDGGKVNDMYERMIQSESTAAIENPTTEDAPHVEVKPLEIEPLTVAQTPNVATSEPIEISLDGAMEFPE